MHKFTRYLYFTLPALVFIACSTQKNTAISRFYNDLTSHYNIFFNGDESYKKGMLTLEQNYDDDFSELLPVFLYSKKGATSAIAPEMDRAVKKAQKLISLHSITAKPDVKNEKDLTPKQTAFLNKKEYNKWVDDAYLLMGKALFYKPDYDKAEQTFNYILVNYPESPCVFESKLWLARMDLEKKKFHEAEDYLNSLKKDISLPDDLIGPLNATWADYYIKQKEYQSAIAPLKKAIEYTRKKFKRTRYTYLLAQLYAKNEEENIASQTYVKVIKMNPPYKMTFNAKINRALTYEKGGNSRKDIEKQLSKMLKDDKNNDYQDQIYYAIGNLYYKDEKTPEAIKYYKLSLAAKKDNTQQTAKTDLTLANLYYVRPDYVNAQAYYDSAVSVIDQNYPNYQEIYTKSVSLTNLVNAINTVHLQDSLLTLSKMSKEELNALADKMIDQEQKREEAQQEKEQERAEASTFSASNSQFSNNNTNSWYFYNPTAKSIGHKEFIKIWGNRKLEDNWRRENKKTVSFGEDMTANNENSDQNNAAKSQGNVVTNKKTRAYYLQNIPFTDSARVVAQKKIAASLYNMGNIYSDELKDYPKATQAFEELLKRYPNYDNRLQVYYKLYTIAHNDKDKERLAEYQQKIINQFPNSNFAKLMTNPDYLKELAAQEHKADDFYMKTYELFKAGKFDEVSARSERGMKEYPNHKLYSKFDYLHTVSAGLKKDTLSFIMDLQAYISRYPKTELAENAQIMINYLQKKQPKVVEQQNRLIAKKLFTSSYKEPHDFIYIVPKEANMNQLIFNIINFNLDNYDSLKLQVKKLTIAGKTNLCVVSSFKSGSDAVNYYNSILKDKKVFKDVGTTNIQPAVISQTNYRSLKNNGKTNQYLFFFKENYKVNK